MSGTGSRSQPLWCLAGALFSLLLSIAGSAYAGVVLNRGNDGDPETLDAHKTSTVAEGNLLRDLYEGLVIHDLRADVVAGAAESWTISPDGRAYTFKLRSAGRWSNGDPVVAQDFVYSLRRLLDPATGSKYAPVMFPILNAEKVHKGEATPDALGARAPDPLTVVILLERPTAYFLELLTNQTALPVHAASIARLGADWLKPGNMVSNGAYTLKSFVPNGSIVLAKNPRFHAAGGVVIDEVRYFPTADAGAATRRFRAGELHITTDIPTDQFAGLKERLGDQVKTAPYLGTSFLIINTRKTPFDDVRVRRALALGVDREFLADEIWSGTMLPAFGMVPPGVKNYPRNAVLDFIDNTPVEREDEARALLAAAGFGNGRPPLKVELRYNMTDNNQRTMVAVASQWKQIGVESRFVHTDGKTHFAHLRDGGDFDVARYGWIADYSDAQNFLFLLESANVGLNVGRYANPEFDAAMRRAADEPDLTRRAGHLFAADSLFVRDVPWIPLMFYQSKSLVSPKVTGFVANQQAAHATRYLALRP